MALKKSKKVTEETNDWKQIDSLIMYKKWEKKGDIVLGEVVDKGSSYSKLEKKDVPFITLHTEDALWKVGKKGGLAQLIALANIGDQVKIIFKGKSGPDKSDALLFECYLKEK
jgi:hypothetical protein